VHNHREKCDNKEKQKTKGFALDKGQLTLPLQETSAMSNAEFTESTENVEQLREETVTRHTDYEGPRGAGFAIRATARIVDTLLGFAVAIVAMVLAFIILAFSHTLGSPDLWAQNIQRIAVSDFLLGFCGVMAYHATSEYFGASVGKLICGLRVIGKDLTPVTVKGVLIGNTAYLLDGLFFGLVGYASMSKSPAQQRLGDVWGRTMVMKKKDLPPHLLKPVPALILAIIAGLAAYTAIVTFSYLIKVA